MTDLTATHELLALIRSQITNEEKKLRDLVNRLRSAPDDRTEVRLQEANDNFRRSIEPLLQQRQHILDQLAAIEACKPLPTVLLPR